MKKTKILAVLAGAIGLSLFGSASTYATISTDTNGKVLATSPNDTISLSNVESTDTFTYCKIVDIKYDQATNAVSYNFTSDFQTFLSNSTTYNTLTIDTYRTYTGSTEGQITGDTNLDRLAGDYAKYLREHNSSCSSMTVSGTSASATVAEAGSYIILPTSSTKVYSVMIANIGVKTEETSGTVDYVLDSTNAEITAKKGNPGAVLKTANKDIVAIGETITYTLEASVPSYPANVVNTAYKITDTPAAGSTVVFDTAYTPVVKAGGAVLDSSKYTITFTSTSLVVDIPETKGLTSPITVEYHATISDASRAGVSQGNEVVMEYPVDFYNPSSATTSSTTSKNVKTLGIKIKKTSDESGNPALAGAEFQLFTDSTATGTPITCYTDIAGGSATNTTLATGTVQGEDGVAICRGLTTGTYYLKETKAPVGYTLNSNIIAIEVTEASATSGISGSTTYTTGYKQQDVVNTKTNFALPFTGGRGVVIYAIAGISIVTVASVYYARKKKQEA